MKRILFSIIILIFTVGSISLAKPSNKTASTTASNSSVPTKPPVAKLGRVESQRPEVIKPVIPGIIDVFQSSFLYVYGTQAKEPRENRVIKRTVEDVIGFWKIGRDRTEQYKADTEVTLSDISSYHLLLYGSPSSNKIIAQIYKQLPLLIEPNGVVAGDKKFTDDGVGVILIHPNPLYPKKYVVVFWASTFKGMRWINSVPYGKTDYVIFDERSFLLPKIEQTEPPVLEKGMFDKTDPLHWKYVPSVIEIIPPIKVETSFEF
ncbi:MAG: hypothetical protein QME64_04800 [bacterium]|nr:hypothetical protein [bacterium]